MASVIAARALRASGLRTIVLATLIVALTFLFLMIVTQPASAQVTSIPPVTGGSSGNATTVNGAAVPVNQTCIGTNSSGQPVAGICPSAPAGTGPVIVTSGTQSAANTGAVQVSSAVTVLRDSVSFLDPSIGGFCNGTDESAAFGRAAASTKSIGFPDGATCKYATPITITHPIFFYAKSTSGTTIQYTGTTNPSVGMTWNGSITPDGNGLLDIRYAGTSAAGTTGLLLGGALGARNWRCERCIVTGFDIGVTLGDNAFNVTFSAGFIGNFLTHGFYIPGSLNNTGENIAFDNTPISGNGATFSAECVRVDGSVSPLTFSGGFALDGGCGLYMGPSAQGAINLVHGNIESDYPVVLNGPPIFQAAGSNGYITVNVSGVTFSLDQPSVPTAYAFIGMNSGTLNAYGNVVQNLSPNAIPFIAASGTVNINEYGTSICCSGSTMSQLIIGSTGGYVRKGTHSIPGEFSFSNDPAGYYQDQTGVLSPNPTVTFINLLTNSNVFSNAAWSSYNTLPNMVANTSEVPAPDGSSTATKVTANGPYSGFTQNVNPPLIPGQTYTVSIWARTATGGGTQYIGLGTNDTVSNPLANSTWQRFNYTQTVPATGGRGLEFYVFSASATVYIWGAQVVPGSLPGAYIPTTTAAYIPADWHVLNGITASSINPVPLATTKTGTAGTALCSMSFQGTIKTATCYLAAYANTGAAQTYPFPVAFSGVPVLLESGGSCGTYNPTSTASALTLPANAAMTAETCNVVVMGQ